MHAAGRPPRPSTMVQATTAFAGRRSQPWTGPGYCYRVWLSGKPGPARRGGGNLQSHSRLAVRTTADCGVGAKLATADWRVQHRRIFSRQPRVVGAVSGGLATLLLSRV